MWTSKKERIFWLLNRLRVMSVGEVIHRLTTKARQIIEQLLIKTGWKPTPKLSRLAFTVLYKNPQTILSEWHRHFELDRLEIDKAKKGSITLFGKHYDVGTRPDWNRDPQTGRVAPSTFGKSINYRDENTVGNIKTLWELGRHQHLIPLAVNYAISGDKYSFKILGNQIDDWIETNPYGIGIHWCSSLEVALRAIAWVSIHNIVSLRCGEKGLFAVTSDEPALKRAMYQHCYFIVHHLSKYSSANNHLIGELVGILAITSCFDWGPKSARWRANAKSTLEKEALLQVTSDGVAKEQATHYQLEVMEYLSLAICLGYATGQPLEPSVLSRVLGMQKFLSYLSIATQGMLPRIGDSDEGAVTKFRLGDLRFPELELMDSLKTIFGNGNTPKYEKGFWYSKLLPDTVFTSPKLDSVLTSRKYAKAFPEGGYAILRSESLNILFDAGPLGYPSIAAHGHADALSFCLAWQGNWWLVDPGTYAYHGDQTYRDYFRSTQAHNTLTINGLNQSQIGGPFLWTRHAQAKLDAASEKAQVLHCSGHHTGYQSLGIRHDRRLEISASGKSVLIEDHLHSECNSAVEVAAHFHFGIDIDVTLNGGVAIATRAGTKDRMYFHLDPAMEWSVYRGARDPLLGWYSGHLGQIEPCITLRGVHFGNFEKFKNRIDLT